MDHALARAEMVANQLVPRGITDPAVLEAVATVERHRFIPASNRDLSYRDGPVAIGSGQTISQPYLVALMSQTLLVKSGMNVLEIGSGSGYQAAILAALGADVCSIEIRPPLVELSRQNLAETQTRSVTVEMADGHHGWPRRAPFDRVIVTAAPETIPSDLLDQLRPGGRMVIPVGPRHRQRLLLVEKALDGKTRTTDLLDVLFVPMTPKG